MRPRNTQAPAPSRGCHGTSSVTRLQVAKRGMRRSQCMAKRTQPAMFTFAIPILQYCAFTHFCCRACARMPDLVSEVDSDRRAARASRAWPLPGSGARARASGSGGRAQPAARRIMSHGHWNNFAASQAGSLSCMHGCMHGISLWMHGCDAEFWLAGCLLRPRKSSRGHAT